MKVIAAFVVDAAVAVVVVVELKAQQIQRQKQRRVYTAFEDVMQKRRRKAGREKLMVRRFSIASVVAVILVCFLSLCLLSSCLRLALLLIPPPPLLVLVLPELIVSFVVLVFSWRVFLFLFSGLVWFHQSHSSDVVWLFRLHLWQEDFLHQLLLRYSECD